MTNTTDLNGLRDAFRAAVATGASGAIEYASWLRAHTEQAHLVQTENFAETSRVRAIDAHRSAEHAWLCTEARNLEGNAKIVGLAVCAPAFSGDSVVYTQDIHDARVAAWRNRLTEYSGRDCSAVEPRYHYDCVPEMTPQFVRLLPDPKPAPQSYDVELAAAVSAMVGAS